MGNRRRLTHCAKAMPLRWRYHAIWRAYLWMCVSMEFLLVESVLFLTSNVRRFFVPVKNDIIWDLGVTHLGYTSMIRSLFDLKQHDQEYQYVHQIYYCSCKK